MLSAYRMSTESLTPVRARAVARGAFLGTAVLALALGSVPVHADESMPSNATCLQSDEGPGLGFGDDSDYARTHPLSGFTSRKQLCDEMRNHVWWWGNG